MARNEISEPMAGGNRRLFLASALALGFATAARGVLGEELEPKDVNKHLDRIPRKLPHVVRRREDLYEGAKHGLIVIRQIHWADGLDAQGAAEIARCQEEIRALVLALKKGGWIDSVHAEGMMAAGEPRPDPAYSSSQTAEQQGLRDVPRIAEVGAIDLLMANKEIEVKGGEKTAQYDAAGPALSLSDGPKKQKLLFEDREEALLELVLAARDRIACTVYGAAHDWEWNVEDRNLAQWNEEHPDQIISLLTLTTKAVADYDRKRMPPKKQPLPVPPPPEPMPPREQVVPGSVEFGPKKKKGGLLIEPFIDFPY